MDTECLEVEELGLTIVVEFVQIYQLIDIDKIYGVLSVIQLVNGQDNDILFLVCQENFSEPLVFWYIDVEGCDECIWILECGLVVDCYYGVCAVCRVKIQYINYSLLGFLDKQISVQELGGAQTGDDVQRNWRSGGWKW